MALVNRLGTFVPNPPQRVSVATSAAIQVVNRSTTYYPANPIVPGDQAYDSTQVREPGQVLYDPVTKLHIVTYSASPGDGTDPDIAAYLSANGEVDWYPHPSNVLTAGRGEDPYIAKDINTGHVWRDSGGRALIFCEEKPSFDGQGGVDLWRSSPNLLTGWTKYGTVIDKGGVGDWDESFRASPVVIWDGTRLVMVWEGGSPTNAGELGFATSTDEGLTWTVSPAPIVVRGAAGTWNDTAVVCDDIIKVGSSYVLLVHCWGTRAGNGSGFNNLGRYITTDAPVDWDNTSWVEMPGNPYSTESNTAMCVHNDPGRLSINMGNANIWFADYALA